MASDLKRLGFTILLALAFPFRLSAEKELDPDIALGPAHSIVNSWRFHIPPTKRQSMPGIERTAKGRHLGDDY